MHEAGVVIVGGGQAAADAATSLRQQGFQGAITMIAEEAYLPYRRPPLSKAFLAGEADIESLYLRGADVYAKHDIACRTGTRAVQIDTAGKRLTLSCGEQLAYGRLVLALGGRPRQLPVDGAGLENVHYVRTIRDVLALRPGFQAGRRLVIIGGGYIGLEVAAVARKTGLHVTVVEALPRVLARVTAPELSAFYERAHGQRGVQVLTGVGVAALAGEGRVEHVVLADGRRLPADLVIAGIGLVPSTELAGEAGLEVAPGGIVVDRFCRTSEPDIYAIGDCTFHENVFYGRHMRVESVPNATEQARVLAANFCGKAAEHAAVPWFWSDQYDLKLQMVGLSEGYDQLVLRGSVESESFIAFYLREGVVIAADSVNRPQEFMVAKRLVADRVRVPEEVLRHVEDMKSVLRAA